MRSIVAWDGNPGRLGDLLPLAFVPLHGEAGSTGVREQFFDHQFSPIYLVQVQHSGPENMAVALGGERQIARVDAIIPIAADA
jgi:hypothetical protein